MMDISKRVHDMDALVTEGAILDAVSQFFAEDAKTTDLGEVLTNTKEEAHSKLSDFVGAIAEVKGITFHRSWTSGTSSASEFTFHFLMKDGSTIFWHEIIRRLWNDAGFVTEEVYFQAAPIQ